MYSGLMRMLKRICNVKLTLRWVHVAETSIVNKKKANEILKKKTLLNCTTI
jgi:hypothetical protein